MISYYAYVTGKPTDIAEPRLLIQSVTTRPDSNVDYGIAIDIYCMSLSESFVLTWQGDYDYAYLDALLAVVGSGYRICGAWGEPGSHNWYELGGQIGTIIVPIHH